MSCWTLMAILEIGVDCIGDFVKQTGSGSSDILYCNEESVKGRGMAVVMKEAVRYIYPPPEGMESCDPFI